MHPIDDFETLSGHSIMATASHENFVDKFYNNNESPAVYFYTQPSAYSTFAYQTYYHQQQGHQETSSDVDYHHPENGFFNSECLFRNGPSENFVQRYFYGSNKEGIQKSDVENMKRHDCSLYVCNASEFSEKSDVNTCSDHISQLLHASGETHQGNF